MKTLDSWHSDLKEKTDEVGSSWMTVAEFRAVISDLVTRPDSPIRGLQYAITGEPPFRSFDVGYEADGDFDSETLSLGDNRNGHCRAKWWLKPETALGATVRREPLAELFNAWWKPSLRTPSAGLPDLKRDVAGNELGDVTLARRLNRGDYPAVLFCDLDNFGQVNKLHGGQAVGDRVIKEFAAVAEVAIADYGILLHNGGDELVVLCPRGGSLTAIRAAYAIHSAIAKHDFGVGTLKLGMSVGLATTDAPLRVATFQDLKGEADHVLHTYAKKPTKGRARFAPAVETSPVGDWPVADAVALGKALVTSAIAVVAPFGNAWLNALASLVHDVAQENGFAYDKVAAPISAFVAWMGGENQRTPMLEGNPPQFVSASTTISVAATPLDIVFAIAHGILAASARTNPDIALVLEYAANGHAARIRLESGLVLWSSPSDAALTEKCRLCAPPRATKDDLQTPLGAARAILVKIGHSLLPVSAHLFSEIIVVDDRPTRGGCLPDFWEVTIARLVARIHNDPNTYTVFVVGDHKHGGETVARLRGMAEWEHGMEEMASRLSVTAAMLKETVARLVGRIHFPESYQELVRSWATALDDAPPLHPQQGVPRAMGPLLVRELRMDSMALRREDGCRVQTAAQAFPVILEILRKADAPRIRDQAGREVRELIDFKVFLESPEQDMIPAYYGGQQNRMQEYFRGAFEDELAFFGKALRIDGQLDAVLDHLANVIKQEARAFATRRAILVVPHETKGRDDLTPLGLVSVRIIPRFAEGRCVLSYSATWRTVEALVGFPYSLYGSVRFGQELTRLVRERLPAPMRTRVAMGALSYLAHSLHMFTDEFGQAIVRHIVNEATD